MTPKALTWIPLVLVSFGVLSSCSDDTPRGTEGLTAASSTAAPATETEDGQGENGQDQVLEVEVGDSTSNSDSGTADSGTAESGTDDGTAVTVPEGVSEWVVVVAGATDPFDSILSRSVDLLATYGYEGQISNCERGAAEAIGMAPDSTFTVTAGFDSEQAANDAVAALAENNVDVVAVQIVVACPE